MSKEYIEALERLAMPDELHIKECEKLGIGLTEDYDLIKKTLLQVEETSDCIYYIVETLVSNLAKPEPYDNIMGYVKTYQEAKIIIKNLENKYPKYTANNGIAYPIFRIEMMTKFEDEDRSE